MNKTSKFWKLFKKDDKPQKEKDVISTLSQLHLIVRQIPSTEKKSVQMLKKKISLTPKKSK